MKDQIIKNMRALKREFMYELWEKAKKGNLEGLNEEDRRIAQIMIDHEDEFHNQFEFSDITSDHEFDPDTEVNPFMHISIHSAVETQLAEKDPIEVFQFYNAMRKKKSSHHDTLHLIGALLAPLLFNVFKNQSLDIERYRSTLKKFKTRKPEKIYDLIDTEYEDIFDSEDDPFEDEEYFDTDEVTSDYAKTHLDTLIKRVDEDGEAIIIKNDNGREAVLIPRSDFEFLEDSLSIPFDDFDDDLNDVMEDDDPDDYLFTSSDNNYENLFQFKISLRGIIPSIWRSILVPQNYTFWDLHVAIQDAMGWEDIHLHQFEINNPLTREKEKIGPPDEFAPEENIIKSWQKKLSSCFSAENSNSLYIYDFGDNWEHTIILEKIVPRKKGIIYPVCLDGRRACPPEDCGGIPGYTHLLKAISDPDSEEYEHMIEWIGKEFQPENFDPDEVEFEDPMDRWDFAFGDD